MCRCAQPKHLASSARQTTCHTPDSSTSSGSVHASKLVGAEWRRGESLRSIFNKQNRKGSMAQRFTQLYKRVCTCIWLIEACREITWSCAIWLRRRPGDGLMRDAHALENKNHRPKHAINAIKHVHISSSVVHIRQWLHFQQSEETSKYRLPFLPDTDFYRDLHEAGAHKKNGTKTEACLLKDRCINTGENKETKKEWCSWKTDGGKCWNLEQRLKTYPDPEWKRGDAWINNERTADQSAAYGRRPEWWWEGTGGSLETAGQRWV